MASRQPPKTDDHELKITLGSDLINDIDRVIERSKFPTTRVAVIRVALRSFLDDALKEGTSQ